MSDMTLAEVGALVERLRKLAHYTATEEFLGDIRPEDTAAWEAADLLSTLAAGNERLRDDLHDAAAMLDAIRFSFPTSDERYWDCAEAADKARDAAGPEEPR